MKLFLLIALASLFTACSSVSPTSKPKPKRLNARITFYTDHEDKYGAHTSSGRHACEGRTVAAHPDFAFGTQLSIPALKSVVGSSDFVVEDRGSAVTAKRASVFGEYVFDVFLHVKNRRQGKKRIAQLGSMLTHAEVLTVH